MLVLPYAISRDHYKVNRITYSAFLSETVNLFCQFLSAFGGYCIWTVPELHFADIDNMVCTAYHEMSQFGL